MGLQTETRPSNQWQLQEAKNKLSAVIRAAAESGAQVVTVHGAPAAIVLSPKDYAQLVAARESRPLSQALCLAEISDEEHNAFSRDRTMQPTRDLVL